MVYVVAFGFIKKYLLTFRNPFMSNRNLNNRNLVVWIRPVVAMDFAIMNQIQALASCSAREVWNHWGILSVVSIHRVCRNLRD